MGFTNFVLPDLGEGLTESEIASWRVAEGERVVLNQVVAEVETAKALVELPSPYEGVIARLYVSEGVVVNVGDPIIAFELDAAEEPPGGVLPEGTETTTQDHEAAPPNLVGYGAVSEAKALGRRARKQGAPLHQVGVAEQSAPGERPRTRPPVRRLAKQLGVDLDTITATGESGLITRFDVERANAEGAVAPAQGVSSVGTAGTERSETTLHIPVKGVRKFTAEAMVRSAFTAPHVTVFMTVDVTKTVKLLDRARSSARFADVRLTFLAAVARAACLAIAQHPEVNSRWDEASASILQFGEVQLGIAAATPRGLLVPTLRSADRLDLFGLATTLDELVQTARTGKTTPADLAGGTFTISNVGVFGVDAGTPILNDGQAAILALGAVSRRPWEHKGRIRLRHVTTLSLSFDHRVLDGEQGSRFLSAVAQLLREPGDAFLFA